MQVSMVRTSATHQLPMNWLSMVQRYDVALAPVCRGLNTFWLARRVLPPLQYKDVQPHHFPCSQSIPYLVFYISCEASTRLSLNVLPLKNHARGRVSELHVRSTKIRLLIQALDSSHTIDLARSPAHAPPITLMLGSLDAALSTGPAWRLASFLLPGPASISRG